MDNRVRNRQSIWPALDHWKRSVAYWCIALLCGLLWLGLGVKEPVHAGGCGQTYTVQPGDTLSGVARRYGVGLKALLALNPQIRHPDRIYVGQVLCLSGASGVVVTPPPTATPALTVTPTLTASPAAPVNEPQVALEITHRLPKADLDTVAVGPIADALEGIRQVYRLLPGEEGLRGFLSPDELRMAAEGDTGVALWLARPDPALDYLLVSVGSPDLLADLRPDLTAPVPETTRPLEPVLLTDLGPYLGMPESEVLALTVWLEPGRSDNVRRIPLPVAAVMHLPSAAEAASLWPDVYMVLSRVGDEGYRLMAVLREQDAPLLGPPGILLAERCARWTGNRWYYAWLRAWFGCPRR